MSGLALGEAFRPDVMLLDIGLPDVNGYELARRVRASDWGRGVQLIAITGWGQDADRQRAFEAGFDHHLTKPVTPQVIETLLREPQVA
jgi:CheY-like chemotaxis protein